MTNKINNLIIQFGDCNFNCPHCYLKNFNIKRNYKKFMKVIKKLEDYQIDTLCLSYQNQQSDHVYNKIMLGLKYNNLIITTRIDFTLDYNTYDKSKKTTQVYYSYPSDYNYNYDNISFYLNNNNFNKLEKLCEIIKNINSDVWYYGSSYGKVYLSIEKKEKLDLTELFKIYNKYPEILELDSCYKRILQNKKCNDVYVLNEDGNLYTCPYTLDYMDNEFKNEMKECPFIKF